MSKATQRTIHGMIRKGGDALARPNLIQRAASRCVTDAELRVLVEEARRELRIRYWRRVRIAITKRREAEEAAGCKREADAIESPPGGLAL